MKPDTAGRTTFQAYAAFHGPIERSYRDLGYRLVAVPKVDVRTRMKFIESHVADELKT